MKCHSIRLVFQLPFPVRHPCTEEVPAAPGTGCRLGLCLDRSSCIRQASAPPATLSDDGKYYILNGEASGCTNGTIAELMVGMARTGPKKITAFIVEADWPGVEVFERLHFMGLKALENGIIRSQRPGSGGECDLGRGQRPQAGLDHPQYRAAHLAVLAVAGVKKCRKSSREMGLSRVQWGAPIGNTTRSPASWGE